LAQDGETPKIHRIQEGTAWQGTCLIGSRFSLLAELEGIIGLTMPVLEDLGE